MVQIVSKADAIAAGSTKYYTGVPCKYGHLAERYVFGGCVECERLRRNSPAAKERMRQYSAKRRQDPTYREYHKAYNREYGKSEQAKHYQREYNADPAVRTRRRMLQQQHRRTTRSQDWYLKRKYGITLAEKTSMLEAQNNLCAICQQVIALDGTPKENTIACLDHCHTTGKIRGLLCNSCNKGLGNFRDSVESLQNAITYLTKEQNEFK